VQEIPSKKIKYVLTAKKQSWLTCHKAKISIAEVSQIGKQRIQFSW
jgi:hypothetical protein